MSPWTTVALGDVFEIARGGSPRPIDSYVTDDPAGISWITISDASEGSKYITQTKRRIKPEGVKRSRSVRPGDFLLTNSMSFGRPYIMGTSGCIHDGWLVLSPRRDDVDREFFYYLLGSRAVYSEFERLASGVTVKNLNIDLVKRVTIPLPPLSDQRRIAEILDKADALRARRRAALGRLDTLTQAIFLDMFGDPIGNPKEWSTHFLSALSRQIQIGPFGSLLHEADYVAGGTPIINPKHIQRGRIVIDPSETVSPSKCRALSLYILRNGDVVMARRGEMGRCAVVGPDHDGFVCGTGSLFIRSNTDKVTSLYLAATLSTTTMRRRLEQSSLGLTLPNLNQAIVEALPVPQPPLQLQHEFAQRICAIEHFEAKSHEASSGLDRLFASLQHRAFRGEL